MILRAVAVVSLILMLAMVLYLPSAHPPERFMAQIRIEHDLNMEYWGQQHALPMLERMMDIHTQTQNASPIPPQFTNQSSPVDTAVAAEISGLSARALNNQYFKSLEMLVALASYRYAQLAQWFPMLLIFVAAAVFDGCIRRIVKSKEFLQHDPEMFALHTSMLIIVACSTVVSFVIPVTIPPYLFAAVPLFMGGFASLALANFHYRG